MSHAERCPVCNGSGKYEEKECHGCNGKGWITVEDKSNKEYIPYIPYYPPIYPVPWPQNPIIYTIDVAG